MTVLCRTPPYFTYVLWACTCLYGLNLKRISSSSCVAVLSGNFRGAISDKNRRVLQTGSLQSAARIQLLTVYGEGRTQIMNVLYVQDVMWHWAASNSGQCRVSDGKRCVLPLRSMCVNLFVFSQGCVCICYVVSDWWHKSFSSSVSLTINFTSSQTRRYLPVSLSYAVSVSFILSGNNQISLIDLSLRHVNRISPQALLGIRAICWTFFFFFLICHCAAKWIWRLMWNRSSTRLNTRA